MGWHLFIFSPQNAFSIDVIGFSLLGKLEFLSYPPPHSERDENGRNTELQVYLPASNMTETPYMHLLFLSLSASGVLPSVQESGLSVYTGHQGTCCAFFFFK